MGGHQHRAHQRLDAVASRYRPVWEAMEAARRDVAAWPPHVYVSSAAAGDAAGDVPRCAGEQTVRELLALGELGMAKPMPAAVPLGRWCMTLVIYRIYLHPYLAQIASTVPHIIF